jgi:hypothetical protein
MSDLHLHIISFDIPWPANYGGVIDVFYKAKALAEHGVKVHLHCFEYGRKQQKVLEATFFEVRYYKRDISKKHLFKNQPYIVSTRDSELLVKHLLEDDYPILMEGIHTSNLLHDKRLKKRVKLVRTHNIEHDYYLNLSRVEKDPFKKYYFYNESVKLARYEKTLSRADALLCISENDFQYFSKKFSNVILVPAFHPYREVTSQTGKGKYVLYHGNLSVPENANAVRYLIDEVFKDLNIPFVVAGLKPSRALSTLIQNTPNLKLVANPDDEKLNTLIREAQINVSVTFQVTGLKLKLLNNLYQGRFCLVNSAMLSGSQLDALCEFSDHPLDMKRKIQRLMTESFSSPVIEHRKKVLGSLYNNGYNVDRIISLIS